MARRGLRIEDFVCKCPLKLPKVVKVDCSRTTQFASAIMMSFSSTTEVIPLNMNSSHSYWDLTLQNILDVQKGEVYSVPLDWSSASYPSPLLL